MLETLTTVFGLVNPSLFSSVKEIALDDARKNLMEIIEPMNLKIKGIKNIKINQDFNGERNNPQIRYEGVLVLYDDWNNIRDSNISVVTDVEFEVGR